MCWRRRDKVGFRLQVSRIHQVPKPISQAAARESGVEGAHSARLMQAAMRPGRHLAHIVRAFGMHDVDRASGAFVP